MASEAAVLHPPTKQRVALAIAGVLPSELSQSLRYGGLALRLLPGLLGAGYFILSAYVPLLLIAGGDEREN